jgi:YggT family protein
MPSAISSALLFLINTLFDLYLFILVVRLILVWVGANYYDPITQFIVKMTDTLVKPIRRRIPNINRFETATFLLLIGFESIKYLLVALLSVGMPNIIGLLLLSCGDIIRLIIQIFFYAIILQAILSWIQPNGFSSYFLTQFTSPIMRPIQRFVPPVGGFDITPIPALILLQLLLILLVNPLMTMGMVAAFS